MPAYQSQSTPPEVLNPRRTQFRVSDRVLNVLVAEIGLQRPSVVPLIRQWRATHDAGITDAYFRVRLG